MPVKTNPSLSSRRTTRCGGPRWVICGLVMLALGAYRPLASAQTYSINRYALVGGGGSSASGTYSISGAIGQPVAGTSANGAYSLATGLWTMLTVVQDTGAPRLNLSMTTTNTVLLAWPSASTGFELQQTADSSFTNWVNVTAVPFDDGTIKSVVFPPQVGHVLFRLKKAVGGTSLAK